MYIGQLWVDEVLGEWIVENIGGGIYAAYRGIAYWF